MSILEVNDVFGLSGPLKKLIAVISKGIGAVYKPYLIRRTADAKAYEIKVIANAISENQKEFTKIDYSRGAVQLISLDPKNFQLEQTVTERVQSRVEFQEEKRQHNIESITQKAAAELVNEESVSEEPVDDDWTARFFEYAKDISNKELQELWAKILAGEVKRPKSFSLRTLDLLRNLTKDEAQSFSKIAKLKVSSGANPFVFKGRKDDFLEGYSVTFNDRLLLTELGLLLPDTGISRRFDTNPTDLLILFQCGKYLIKASKKANTPEYRIPLLRFSKIGEELLNLIVNDPDEGYVKEFFFFLQSAQIEVEYSFIISMKDGMYEHSKPWIKFDNS